MNYQVDPQFVTRTTNLVREILSDEAHFVSRNDQTFQLLHNKIFSKAEQTSFQNLQDTEKTFFNKYFYVGGAVGSPRLDVPFADSPEDQAFFFDQFRNQIKNITYNYDRMDFLRPGFSDEKAQTPQFDNNQTLLLTHGLVYPCLAALEQRQIAKTAKKKASPGSDENVETSDNPYATLGDKVLVKGPSGEFDQILTYAQLELIAAQEDLLHQQGLSQDEIIARLREYITKTFPDLNIVLDAEGKVQTFLSSSGFSASGLTTSPAGAAVSSSISFSDLVKEMKIRLGRQVQSAAIAASKNNLAPAAESFQIKNANGITTTVNGLTLSIDQAGEGNNAIFFLKDRQGVSARFSIPLDDLRLAKKTSLNLAIYQKPAEDNPAGPKLAIAHDEMEKLQKALLALYAQSQTPGEYDPAKEKPKLLRPISTTRAGDLPGTKPLPSTEATGQELGASSAPDFELQFPVPLSVGFVAKPRYTGALKTTSRSTSTTKTSVTKVMPKIPARPLQQPPAQTAKATTPVGKPTAATGQYQQKIPNQEQTPPATPPAQKRKIPAVMMGLVATGAATAGAIAAALTALLR